MLQHGAPQFGAIDWRFADEGETVVCEQKINVPDRRRYVTKAAGRDHIEGIRRLLTDGGNIKIEDNGVLPQAQGHHRASQEISPRSPPLDHRHGQVGSPPGNHKRRQTSA